MVRYAYDQLADNEMLFENGKNSYGAGSWARAASPRRLTFRPFQPPLKTHIYTTDNIEIEWRNSFRTVLHDHTLFFDNDKRVYMIYGVYE